MKGDRQADLGWLVLVFGAFLGLGACCNAWFTREDLEMPLFHADTADVAPLVAPYSYGLSFASGALALCALVVAEACIRRFSWARRAALLWAAAMFAFVAVDITLGWTVISPLYERHLLEAERQGALVRHLRSAAFHVGIYLSVPALVLAFFRRRYAPSSRQ